MHTHSVDSWRHDHIFLGAGHMRNERRTWLVAGVTALMMFAEIVAGLAYGSMALLADGIHMATHAGALAVAGFAYLYARRHARDERFAFGTGKLGELAGYSSAMVLAVIAIMIAVESVGRLMAPVPIRFDDAILVAVIGLVVNLVCAWLLNDGDASHDHGHGHGHGHTHTHDHHHDSAHASVDGRDHNMRSAYAHVLTDAMTSVLAIAGLLAGKFYGWFWMDAVMGIVGGAVIARWSWTLLREAGAVLLDAMPNRDVAARMKQALEVDGDRITDLHVWRVGPGHMAAIVSLVSDRPQAPEVYKGKLADMEDLSHVTIEVHACADMPRAA
jgi:cation diffusion facilitator family transporter